MSFPRVAGLVIAQCSALVVSYHFGHSTGDTQGYDRGVFNVCQDIEHMQWVNTETDMTDIKLFTRDKIESFYAKYG